MVGGHLAACLAVALLGACELVVDEGARALSPADAGLDAADGGADELGPRPEAGPGETGYGDVMVDCSSGCLSPASACLQTCASTQASCLSICHGHGSGPCDQQCAGANASCTSACGSRCAACLLQAACTEPAACPT